jgi:hypothetical protein
MLASSGEVDRFIQGLNNGTIRILPEANNIIVDDSKGNKQTLANRLANAVKDYEYSTSFTVTPHPAAVTVCKAAISEVLSYGVVEFNKPEIEEGVNVLPFIGNETKLKIEIIPGQEPMARISGERFSLNGKVIELNLGNSKEKRLEGVYVSNNVTNYTINASNANVIHNQNLAQNNIINDSFNSLLQQVNKSSYNNEDQEVIKKCLEDVRKDIESKNISQGISKLDSLKQFETVYQMALPWALKVADIALKGQ